MLDNKLADLASVNLKTGLEKTMVLLIHDRIPTGLGESLFGAKAFFINSSQIDDWSSVESSPEFQNLDPEDQEVIRTAFPRSVQVHRIIQNTNFH